MRTSEKLLVQRSQGADGNSSNITEIGEDILISTMVQKRASLHAS
jgi:hypothetical protein